MLLRVHASNVADAAPPKGGFSLPRRAVISSDVFA